MRSDEVLQYLYGHQWAIQPLRQALDYRSKWGDKPFRWADVRVGQPDLNRLVLAGLADKGVNGRYSLVEPDHIAKAIGQLMLQRTQVKAQTKAAPPGTVQMPPGLPPDLFSDIIGYNDVKRDIAYALNATGRIHILLHGPPACMVADERVSLGNGGFAKIAQLGDRHLQPIRVSVQTGVAHGRAIAERFHVYRDQPIMQMITESGKSIKGTPNQPVLVVRSGGVLGRGNLIKEWRRLDELSPGDRVATVVKVGSQIKHPAATGFTTNPYRRGPRFKGRLPTVVTNELASLCGYMLGDGWVDSRGYRSGYIVNESERDLLDQLGEFTISTFGVVPSVEKRLPEGRSHSLGNRTVTSTQPVWMVTLRSQTVALNMVFLANKRVPDFILRSTDRHVGLFLRWLFEADGHVRLRKRGEMGERAGEIGLTSAYVELLRDVQTLLLRFGIHSRIAPGSNLKLTISRKDDIIRFNRYVGFASRKKRARMTTVAAKADTIKKRTRRHRTERIISIEPCGRADVFDIEVPKGNRFVANGIIVHNTAKSMFLEAIAELPGAVLRFGDGMSKAGVRETIIREQPSFLCVDELEKMDRKDDTILLELMEHGTVSMMHHGASDMVESPVRVFAACNNINVLRPELRSRFLKLQIREYTKDEFVQVATAHLQKKGASAAIAKYIAEGVGVKTRDLRDAIRIASMAKSMPDAVYLVGRLGEEASVL